MGETLPAVLHYIHGQHKESSNKRQKQGKPGPMSSDCQYQSSSRNKEQQPVQAFPVSFYFHGKNFAQK